MGLQDIVKVVEHDFTADTVFTHLPAAGTVDIITMSYSYSMIPNQLAAIQNSKKLLKTGGLIAIADFFVKGNCDDCLPSFSRKLRHIESIFHQAWFAMDHVHLLSDAQLEQITTNGNGNNNNGSGSNGNSSGSGLEMIWDNRFRGSVPFLPFLKPYHGVYIVKKVE